MLFENSKKPIYGRHTYIKSYFKLIYFYIDRYGGNHSVKQGQ